jgi:hypothetical protein
MRFSIYMQARVQLTIPPSQHSVKTIASKFQIVWEKNNSSYKYYFIYFIKYMFTNAEIWSSTSILNTIESCWQEEKPLWTLCGLRWRESTRSTLKQSWFRHLPGQLVVTQPTHEAHVSGGRARILQNDKLQLLWERSGKDMPWLVAFANFHSVNVPNLAIFKLPKWHWLVDTIPEKLVTGSCELAQAVGIATSFLPSFLATSWN